MEHGAVYKVHGTYRVPGYSTRMYKVQYKVQCKVRFKVQYKGPPLLVYINFHGNSPPKTAVLPEERGPAGGPRSAGDRGPSGGW